MSVCNVHCFYEQLKRAGESTITIKYAANVQECLKQYNYNQVCSKGVISNNVRQQNLINASPARVHGMCVEINKTLKDDDCL